MSPVDLANLDRDPPDLSLLHSWDDRHAPPCLVFFLLKQDLTNFLPELGWNVILLISVSEIKFFRRLSFKFQNVCEFEF
jgi:hypothetical protein